PTLLRYLSSMSRSPTNFTVFPYTTLFRSHGHAQGAGQLRQVGRHGGVAQTAGQGHQHPDEGVGQPPGRRVIRRRGRTGQDRPIVRLQGGGVLLPRQVPVTASHAASPRDRTASSTRARDRTLSASRAFNGAVRDGAPSIRARTRISSTLRSGRTRPAAWDTARASAPAAFRP